MFDLIYLEGSDFMLLRDAMHSCHKKRCKVKAILLQSCTKSYHGKDLDSHTGIKVGYISEIFYASDNEGQGWRVMWQCEGYPWQAWQPLPRLGFHQPSTHVHSATHVYPYISIGGTGVTQGLYLWICMCRYSVLKHLSQAGVSPTLDACTLCYPCISIHIHTVYRVQG